MLILLIVFILFILYYIFFKSKKENFNNMDFDLSKQDVHLNREESELLYKNFKFIGENYCKATETNGLGGYSPPHLEIFFKNVWSGLTERWVTNTERIIHCSTKCNKEDYCLGFDYNNYSCNLYGKDPNWKNQPGYQFIPGEWAAIDDKPDSNMYDPNNPSYCFKKLNPKIPTTTTTTKSSETYPEYTTINGNGYCQSSTKDDRGDRWLTGYTYKNYTYGECVDVCKKLKECIGFDVDSDKMCSIYGKNITQTEIDNIDTGYEKSQVYNTENKISDTVVYDETKKK